MQYLLDTNICIYIIKKKPPTVFEKFNNLVPGDIGISSVTVAELEYGIAKSRNPENNRKALEKFLSPIKGVRRRGEMKVKSQKSNVKGQKSKVESHITQIQIRNLKIKSGTN